MIEKNISDWPPEARRIWEPFFVEWGIIFEVQSGEKLDESALIQRAMQGDRAAWEPLMLAYQEPVFRLAYLLLGDPDEAEDVAQETFLRAWNNLQRFDPARPLRPWLLRITSNLSHNHQRTAARYINILLQAFHTETPRPGVEETSARDMEAQQLWNAVQWLNLRDQQIIYLRYFLDLSVAETAEAMQVAEGTVKSRLNRALSRLRTVIQSDFPMLKDGSS